MKELQNKVGEFTRKEAELAAAIAGFESKASILNERLSEVKGMLAEIDKKIKAEEKNIVTKTKSLGEHETKLKAMQKIEATMGAELVKIREKRDKTYKSKTDLEAEIDKLAHRAEAKNDFLRGLKENVAIGQLIPAGTGLPKLRGMKSIPLDAEPEEEEDDELLLELPPILQGLGTIGEPPATDPVAETPAEGDSGS